MYQGRRASKKAGKYLGLLIAVQSASSFADLNNPALLAQFNELEQKSALANQQTYDRLHALGCADNQSQGGGACAGDVFRVWEVVRELVHTANQLTAGSTDSLIYSLDLDVEALGFALRWTAAEEFASQGSLSNSFVGGQLSGLAARIAALRLGARGFAVNSYGEDYLAYGSGARGGGASADDGWVRWGGYVNSSAGYGDKDATVLEDAFDFDGRNFNGGIDYRVDESWIVGGTIGYQDMTLDFDSSQSIVDGDVDMDGYSLMPFVLYQSERWFGSFSVGYQQLSFDTTRSIRYPSLNPQVEPTDTTATSKNDASVWSLFSSGGYTYALTSQFSVEPYLSVDYRHINVEKIREEDLNNEGFNFIVDAQDITSFEGITGLKLQYVFTPSFAVLIPYIDAQWHHEFKDQSRDIKATYAGVSSSVDDARFVIPTDAPDADYQIYTLGLSSVLRGGSQSAVGDAAGGALQAYFNFRTIVGMENYTYDSVTVGVRYEF